MLWRIVLTVHIWYCHMQKLYTSVATMIQRALIVSCIRLVLRYVASTGIVMSFESVMMG